MYSFLLYLFVGFDIIFVSLWIYIFTSNTNEIIHVSIIKHQSSTTCCSPCKLTDTAGDTSDTMHTSIIFDHFRGKSSIVKLGQFTKCLPFRIVWYMPQLKMAQYILVSLDKEMLLVCSLSQVLIISSLKLS